MDVRRVSGVRPRAAGSEARSSFRPVLRWWVVLVAVALALAALVALARPAQARIDGRGIFNDRDTLPSAIVSQRLRQLSSKPFL